MRLFVALVPSDDAVEHLQDFLEVRQDAADPLMRWTLPHQWHVTLAFAPAVPEDLLEEVVERLARTAGRRLLPEAAIRGGGAFPHADRAKVLWAGLHLHGDGERGAGTAPAALELARLAGGCRAAFTRSGAQVEGARFRPHVTVARMRRPAPVTRWVRLLDAYEGVTWQPTDVRLIASQLGQGPRRTPRYEELARCPLGSR